MMGAGVWYTRYPHFMLFSEGYFYGEIVDEDDNVVEEDAFDEVFYEDFKEEIAGALKARFFRNRRDWRWLDNDAHIFAETDRFEVGIDWGGGAPCVFVLPKTYEHNFTGEEVSYRVGKEAVKGFNKLIASFPGLFSYPTSGYTSMPYEKYVA